MSDQFSDKFQIKAVPVNQSLENALISYGFEGFRVVGTIAANPGAHPAYVLLQKGPVIK